MKASRTIRVTVTGLLFGAAESLGAAQHGKPAPTVLSDTASPPSARFPERWYPPSNSTVYSEAIVLGEPYTARLLTTGHFTNPRTQEVTTLIQNTLQARDGHGRKREEEEMPRPDPQGRTVMAHQVSVHDPVSHCSFQWMEPWIAPGSPTATVSCMPRELRYTNQNIWADSLVSTRQEQSSNLETTVSEPLGERQTQGVEALGVRQTHTLLKQQGVAQSRVVTEVWYSPELKELIGLKITGEALSGTDRAGAAMPTYELIDIHRGEPDPALFYPPAEYRIESTLPANP